MSRLRKWVITIGVVAGVFGSGRLVASEGVLPLRNWAAPQYWLPGADVHEVALPPDRAGRAPTGTEAAPPQPQAGPAALPFFAITPCRLADTRPGGGLSGPYGPPFMNAAVPRDFPMTGGACGIPANAAAVSMTLSVTNTTGVGFLRCYPQGGSAPLVAALTFERADQTISNAAILPLGTGGGLTILPGVSGVDLIIDVNGYYAPTGVVTSVISGATTLQGDVALSAGSNVTITPSGQTLTIAATGGPGGSLPAGSANQTLRHNGTSWVADSLLTNEGQAIGIGANFGYVAALTVEGGANWGRGILGRISAPVGTGVEGVATALTGSTQGVFGTSYSADGTGVQGNGFPGKGVTGVSSSFVGVYGRNGTTSGVSNAYIGTAGIWGDSGSGVGVYATSLSNAALAGVCAPGYTSSCRAAILNGKVQNDQLAGAGNRLVYSDSGGVLTNSSSDGRLKKNVTTLSDEVDVLGAVAALRGVVFNWDTSVPRAASLGDQREIGLIAQEVETVLPQVVGTNGDGYKSVDYAKLTPLLVEAIKAQQEEIRNLQERVEAGRIQERRIRELEARLLAVESR